MFGCAAPRLQVVASRKYCSFQSSMDHLFYGSVVHGGADVDAYELALDAELFRAGAVNEGI